MKPWAFIVGAVLVSAVIVVGLRLDEAGLAVVVGVICGILAGMPVSVALLYMWQRERQERQRLEERRSNSHERQLAAPPVFILNGDRRGAGMPERFLLGEHQKRDFMIVGEEDER